MATSIARAVSSNDRSDTATLLVTVNDGSWLDPDDIETWPGINRLAFTAPVQGVNRHSEIQSSLTSNTRRDVPCLPEDGDAIAACLFSIERASVIHCHWNRRKFKTRPKLNVQGEFSVDGGLSRLEGECRFHRKQMQPDKGNYFPAFMPSRGCVLCDAHVPSSYFAAMIFRAARNFRNAAFVHVLSPGKRKTGQICDRGPMHPCAAEISKLHSGSRPLQGRRENVGASGFRVIQ
jgi:hypothetical protein